MIAPELLLLSSRYRPSPSLEFVRVGGETIQPSSSVRSRGVILNPSVDMEDHIKKICKTCHFHLTNIIKIRSYLDRDSTEAIIHAFVTTNLDYCNAILYGLHWLPVEYVLFIKSCCWYIKLSMVFHRVIYPICSVFVVVPTLCVLARISYGDRRFSIAGPASLRNADSLNSFKNRLKTYLFHLAYS